MHFKAPLRSSQIKSVKSTRRFGCGQMKMQNEWFWQRQIVRGLPLFKLAVLNSVNHADWLGHGDTGDLQIGAQTPVIHCLGIKTIDLCFHFLQTGSHSPKHHNNAGPPHNFSVDRQTNSYITQHGSNQTFRCIHSCCCCHHTYCCCTYSTSITTIVSFYMGITDGRFPLIVW